MVYAKYPKPKTAPTQSTFPKDTYDRLKEQYKKMAVPPRVMPGTMPAPVIPRLQPKTKPTIPMPNYPRYQKIQPRPRRPAPRRQKPRGPRTILV